MCGFVVVLERDPDRPVEGGLLERAAKALAHRGPDDAQTAVAGQVGVAFRRLAVQDLSAAGGQPMSGPAGELLAFNGELYNFRELRAELEQDGVAFRGGSDTEVLLALLLRHGVDETLARIRGMFAFAWWEPGPGRLTLARDRLGQKPLYVWRGPRRVIVASELKALLADPELPRELDPTALDAYLAFLTVPEPLTILRDVEKLLPGTLLELDARGACRRRAAFWDPAPLVGYGPGDPATWSSPERAAAEVRRRLRSAVQSHLVADVPVGAFLSGGLDSAGIAALAAEARREAGLPPLVTFSVAFRGWPGDESAAAAATARALGTEHHAIDVQPDVLGELERVAWHMDEPFGVASAVALFLLAREARRHVTVALSGDGADELFGGYLWRHGQLAPNQLVARLPALPRSLLGLLAPSGAGHDLGGPDQGGSRGIASRITKWLGALRRDDAAIYGDVQRWFREQEVRELLAPGVRAAVDPSASPLARLERSFQAPTRADGVARALFADMRTTLCCEMLAKVDRTSMAHGLEVRVPYLDEGVVEAALALPSRLKVGPRAGKRVLRDALRPLLPAAVLERKKQGFNVPLNAWFLDALRDPTRELLDSLGRRPFMQPGAPARVLERHLAGGPPRGSQLYGLVALEVWCRAFLDAGAGQP